MAGRRHYPLGPPSKSLDLGANRPIFGLEIIWHASKPRGDYYAEARAQPKDLFGFDFHEHSWEDLVIPVADLARLRQRSEMDGTDEPRLRDTLEAVHTWQSQPKPDPAELKRLPEALAEYRRTMGKLIQQRQGPGVPADAAEDEYNRARDHIDGELLQSLARGELAVFLETLYGLEVIPMGRSGCTQTDVRRNKQNKR
jgi:hypothetical protein